MRRGLLWAAALVLLLTGCAAGDSSAGRSYTLGETVSTAWFDYTVTRARAVDRYGGYISGEDEQLVVVNLELQSTYDQAITMFDTDFQLSWADMSTEDTRCMPVEHYCGQQLPEEYQLEAGERRSGVLIYQVPREVETFQFTFQEMFDDGTPEGRLGDTYLTQLDPEG